MPLELGGLAVSVSVVSVSIKSVTGSTKIVAESLVSASMQACKQARRETAGSYRLWLPVRATATGPPVATVKLAGWQAGWRLWFASSEGSPRFAGGKRLVAALLPRFTSTGQFSRREGGSTACVPVVNPEGRVGSLLLAREGSRRMAKKRITRCTVGLYSVAVLDAGKCMADGGPGWQG